jgi:hypothetical protein
VPVAGPLGLVRHGHPISNPWNIRQFALVSSENKVRLNLMVVMIFSTNGSLGGRPG